MTEADVIPLAKAEPSDHPTLPSNIEAEAALLGAIFFGPELLDRVRDIVSAQDFYEPVHRDIFAAICAVADAGGTPNPVTLRPYFDGHEGLKKIGGSNYLVKIATGAASFIGVTDFAKQIRELSMRRNVVLACRETEARACSIENDDDIAKIMEDADCSLTAILNRELSESSGIKQVSAGQAFEEMVEEFEAGHAGVTCGDIACLDETLGPVRPHHLVIMAGRPGMGKTACSLSYALGAARRGHGVLFVSLEMSRIELMQRATAAMIFDGHRGVPYELIRDARLRDDDKRAVFRAGREFKDLPLAIVDAAALTVGRLNAVVRRWKRRFAAKGQSLDLVVVDYLQLMRADGRTNGATETVSQVSMGLKAIAKMHDVGVVALAQLNREVEKRVDKRPQLSDLRDSGQIEQDADAVCFLYREEYYIRQAMTDPTSEAYPVLEQALDRVTRQIDFIVAKRRNGPGGNAKGEFHGVFQAVRG